MPVSVAQKAMYDAQANKMLGRVFSRLTVIKIGKHVKVKARQEHRVRRFLCRCSCGNKKWVNKFDLTSKHTRSCGCLLRDEPPARKHGLAGTPEYEVWAGMRARCGNPKHKTYKDYGGRGIKVCKRWEKFENFIADMGHRQSDRYSIERINNNNGYTPSNCIWATRSQQVKNCRPRRSTKKKGGTAKAKT